MKHSIYTSYDELPLMLSVAEVAAVLGISRAGAYELVLAPGGISHSGPGGNRQFWPDENS